MDETKISNLNSMLDKIIEECFSRALADDYGQFDFYFRVVKLGWIIPVGFDGYDFFNKPSVEVSDEELVKGFVDFFDMNIDLTFSTLVSLEKDVNPNIYKMMCECIEAYKLGLYQICIPALFSITESYLADLSNNGDLAVTKYKSGLNGKVKLNHDGEFWDFETLEDFPERFAPVCYAIIAYLDTYFAPVNFESFTGLNRHAFAHGRQNHNATKEDVVMLMFVITNIIAMYHDVEFSDKE